LGDESSSSATSSSTMSSELSGGAKLSHVSKMVCKAYCMFFKLRPSVVWFGRVGGKGFLKGGLKIPLLQDASSADIFKSMTWFDSFWKAFCNLSKSKVSGWPLT